MPNTQTVAITGNTYPVKDQLKAIKKQEFRHRKCEERNARGYYTTKIYRSGECRDCYEERKMGY